MDLKIIMIQKVMIIVRKYMVEIMLYSLSFLILSKSSFSVFTRYCSSHWSFQIDGFKNEILF